MRRDLYPPQNFNSEVDSTEQTPEGDVEIGMEIDMEAAVAAMNELKAIPEKAKATIGENNLQSRQVYILGDGTTFITSREIDIFPCIAAAIAKPNRNGTLIKVFDLTIHHRSWGGAKLGSRNSTDTEFLMLQKYACDAAHAWLDDALAVADEDELPIASISR